MTAGLIHSTSISQQVGDRPGGPELTLMAARTGVVQYAIKFSALHLISIRPMGIDDLLELFSGNYTRLPPFRLTILEQY